MISADIRAALERQVVGQPRAVNTLVRSVTVGHSGLSSRETPVGMFLLLGPSGTGKTHIASSLAGVLHGDRDRLAVVDCVQLERPEHWSELVRQLAPHFRYPVPGHGDGLRAMAPSSILLVEHIETARSECVQALVAVLETGRVALEDGSVGSLRGCLVLMTSRLCAREIYGADRQEIGFTGAVGDLEETERARIYNLCCNAVERSWGSDFLGHLDDLIIFHRLREPHLALILDRFLGEMNRHLAGRDVRVELEPAARSFLLERSARFLRHGAWYLGKVFRRFVLFPMADLASSDLLQPGSRVWARREGDLLSFSVSADPATSCAGEPSPAPAIDIPIAWDDRGRATVG